MIPVVEAIKIVRAHSATLPPERIPFANALGRFLAEKIVTD
jgi:molybdopterin biosynthesis enzyme